MPLSCDITSWSNIESIILLNIALGDYVNGSIVSSNLTFTASMIDNVNCLFTYGGLNYGITNNANVESDSSHVLITSSYQMNLSKYYTILIYSSVANTGITYALTGGATSANVSGTIIIPNFVKGGFYPFELPRGDYATLVIDFFGSAQLSTSFGAIIESITSLHNNDFVVFFNIDNTLAKNSPAYLIDMCSGTTDAITVNNFKGQLFNDSWLSLTSLTDLKTDTHSGDATATSAAQNNCKLVANQLNSFWSTNNITSVPVYSITNFNKSHFVTDSDLSLVTQPVTSIKNILSDVLNIPIVQFNDNKTNTSFPSLILRQILNGTMTKYYTETNGTKTFVDVPKTQAIVQALIDLQLIVLTSGYLSFNSSLSTVKVLLIGFTLSNPTNISNSRYIYLMFRNKKFTHS
jgi:hypothetical protein